MGQAARWRWWAERETVGLGLREARAGEVARGAPEETRPVAELLYEEHDTRRYSDRRMLTGFARLARRAGSTHAAAAAVNRTMPTAR
jgi:hypothetical protein